jgi:hypothetical protein
VNVAMMFRMYRAACLMVLLAISRGEAFGLQIPGAVRLGIAFEKPSFVLHEPVYAVLSIRNDLREVLRFDLGRDGKSFLSFSIVPPGGQALEASFPPLPGGGGISIITNLALRPGETHVQRLLLNEWYDFPSAGAYSVEVKSSALRRINESLESRFADGPPVPFSPAEKVVVQIGPGDDEQLRRVCTGLATLALSTGPVQPRVDAAFALSLVADPVAIPFLRQLLERGVSVKEYGAAGLARIGNIEATDALIANLSSSDQELRRQIMGALWQIGNATTDPALKVRIETALAR